MHNANLDRPSRILDARTIRALGALALAIFACPAARAGEFLLAPPQPAIPEVRVALQTIDALAAAVQLEGEQEAWLLSVEDCVQLALGQSRTVQAAIVRPLSAGEDIVAARGAFDPLIFGEAAGGTGTLEQSGGVSLFDDGLLPYLRPETADIDTAAAGGQAGLRGITPAGTRYQIDWARTRATLDPPAPARKADTEQARAALTVTQPLLRGVGLAVNRAGIRTAQAARDAAEGGAYQARLDTVAAALAAYWNLAGRYQALVVREAAVRTASALLDDTAARRELGAGSDLDVITAKSGLARRQNDYIEALADAGAASDLLKEILDLRDGSTLMAARLMPSSRPEPIDAAALALDAPIAQRCADAVARRPEPYVAQQERAILDISARVARNGRLPQLDLYGRIEHAAIDEESPARATTTAERDERRWEAGLQGSYPLGARSARAAYRRAKLELDAQDQRIEAARTLVMREVHTALREVRKNLTLLDNARKTVEMERARFAAEEARYQFGESTPFQLLQVQDNLIAEETRLAAVDAALQAAVVELRRAEGILLDSVAPGTPTIPNPAIGLRRN